MVDLIFKILVTNVDLTVTTYQLAYSPEGWNEEMIQWERDKTYWGIFLKFSIPLKFVKDGAGILRKQYFTRGIQANCSLEVWKRNRLGNSIDFAPEYTGKFDFSTSIDTLSRFEITVIDGSIITDLKNKESVVYDIPLPYVVDDAANQIQWDGMPGWFEKFSISSERNGGANTLYINNSTTTVRNERIIISESTFRDINAGFITVSDSYSQLWNVKINQDCRLKLNLMMGTRRYEINSVTVSSGLGFNYVVMAMEEALIRIRGGVVSVLQITDARAITLTTGGTSVSNLYEGEYTIEEEFIAGDQIGTVVRMIYASGEASAIFDYNYICDLGSIMEWVSVYAPLPGDKVPCMTGKEIFTALGQAIGGYPVKSDYLDSDGLKFFSPQNYFQYYLNGVLQPKSRNIKMSIKDFFQHYNSVDSVAIDVEIISGVKTLVMEKFDEVLDVTQGSVDFGNAKNFKIETAKDLIPSTIKAGFKQQTYGDDFGLQEYMSEHDWKTPQNLLTNELNWMSPFRMDVTGFDYQRKTYIDKANTKEGNVQDNTNDAEIFCADCTFDSAYAGISLYHLTRYADNGIQVTDANYQDIIYAFNLNYTPMRNMFRHGAFLSAALYDFIASNDSIEQTAKFQYADLRTELSGITIKENNTIVITDLSTPIFEPLIATFSVPITDAFEKLLTANPKLLGETKWKGATYKGHLMSMSKRLAGAKESEVKILFIPNQDKSKLIY